MNIDLCSLKLHTDKSENIWYAHSDGPPTNTNQKLHEFLFNQLSSIPQVRLIGSKRNVHLILALHTKRVTKQSGSIEVCSPTICETASDLDSPEKTLLAMRRYERPSILGGWHLFRKEDYHSYALSSHIHKCDNIIDDHARRLMKSHIAWHPLSFIPHLSIDHCCQLISTILDPRWFADYTNMGRGSKLRRYLGLDKSTIMGVCNNGPRQRYHKHCELVLNAWKFNEKFDKRKLEHPEYFLWRVFSHAGEKHGPIVAALRTSQVFIEYLRLIWLAALGVGRHQNEALFVPRYFFKTESEADAFSSHFVSRFER